MVIIPTKSAGVPYMLNTCGRRNKNLATDSSSLFLRLFTTWLNVPDRMIWKKQRLAECHALSKQSFHQVCREMGSPSHLYYFLFFKKHWIKGKPINSPTHSGCWRQRAQHSVQQEQLGFPAWRLTGLWRPSSSKCSSEIGRSRIN